MFLLKCGLPLQEAEAAAATLQEWRSVAVEEALYMLSGSYTHPAVRARAVAVLQHKADDNIIYDYMIQLVQCIRHDGQGDSALLASARRLCPIVFLLDAFIQKGCPCQLWPCVSPRPSSLTCWWCVVHLWSVI